MGKTREGGREDGGGIGTHVCVDTTEDKESDTKGLPNLIIKHTNTKL